MTKDEHTREALRQQMQSTAYDLKQKLERPPLWDYENQQEVDETDGYYDQSEDGAYTYLGDEVDVREMDSTAFLNDALETKNLYDEHGELLTALVIITTGGPYTYIDVMQQVIIVKWGRERVELSYVDNVDLRSEVVARWAASL